MLVFCHGDVESVNVVKKALDAFSQVSGLKPNMGMCISFFGNLNEHMKQGILRVMPFRVGKLLVSYLGVPLVTKQIGNKLRPHVVMKTRDGRNTFFWHDKWYTQSPISEHVSMELVIQASQSGNDKINDLIENEEWMFNDSSGRADYGVRIEWDRWSSDSRTGAIYRTEVCTEVCAGAIYPNKVVSEPGYDKQWQKTRTDRADGMTEGRKQNRNKSKSWKIGEIKYRQNITCWNCNQKGHFQNQCLKLVASKGKEVNMAAGDSDDALVMLR
ncbi:retrovirus-related pol polyprotein from transposon TNT 1-94 [Tanacetum coccineum]